MIIIFEGPDRTGKDSQIKLLQALFLNIGKIPSHVLHYSKIDCSNSIEEKSKIMYHDMFRFILNSYNERRVIILNRSHLGEFVYSPMYRNYDGNYVFDIEQKFVKHENFCKIVLITLIDSSFQNTKREDGHSLSNGDIEKVIIETQLFQIAHDKSHIKRKFICDISSLTIQEVHQKILNFLNELLICGILKVGDINAFTNNG